MRPKRPKNDTSPEAESRPEGDPPEEASSHREPTTPEMDTLVVRRSPSTYLPANSRRTSIFLRYFFVLLILLLALASITLWTYLARIKPALVKNPEAASAAPVARAVEVTLPSQTLEQIESNAAQIRSLQQQIDAARVLQNQQGEQLKKIIERLADTRPADTTPHLATTDAAGVASDNPETSPFDPPVSATNTELRLLKERNRLTTYADEAISTGQRRPLNLIIDAMRDPDRASLFHAAQAEYYRVMGHYQLINRINPAYKLPLAELFTGGQIRDEADLNTTQIIAMLENKDFDWQVRLRAAFLLGGRRTPEVGDTLVKAITQDPSLDVAKESQLSFEQNVGRHFLLFDLPGIETWWQTQNGVLGKSGETKPEDSKPEDVKPGDAKSEPAK